MSWDTVPIILLLIIERSSGKVLETNVTKSPSGSVAFSGMFRNCPSDRFGTLSVSIMGSLFVSDISKVIVAVVDALKESETVML